MLCVATAHNKMSAPAGIIARSGAAVPLGTLRPCPPWPCSARLRPAEELSGRSTAMHAESGQGVHRHCAASRGGPGAPCVSWCERQHSPAGRGSAGADAEGAEMPGARAAAPPAGRLAHSSLTARAAQAPARPPQRFWLLGQSRATLPLTCCHQALLERLACYTSTRCRLPGWRRCSRCQ